MPLSRDHARLALATIRLVNGTLALVAPNALLRRLGADPTVNKVAIYPMRMFGIRTVVLGVQLLIDAPSAEADPVRCAHPCHGRCNSDHGRGPPGQLPPRVAVMTSVISLVNTGLAVVIAWPDKGDYS